MLARKVAVEATLAAAQYLAQAKAVEKSTAAMDHEMGQLDKAIDKVDRDLAELATTSKVASRQVDDLGDEARGTAADLKLLDARIEASKLKVRELGVEFARTGEAIDGIALGKERSFLGKLERARKELADLGNDNGRNPLFDMAADAAAAGAKAGSSFASGLAGALDNVPVLKTALIAGVASVVVEAAPLLGAMLGGLFSGGLGTAAMAAGILSTVKDPRVKDAARSAGDIIAADFFTNSEAFVQPVIDGLHILTDAFLDMNVSESLAKLAPVVTTIATGFAAFGKNVMPGLNTALDRMGPFADEAADGFADLGKVLGKFMDDVSSSPGAVEGLAMAFKLLNGTINLVGVGIKYLEDAFHGWLIFNDKALAAAEPLARALGQDGVAESIRQVRAEFQEMIKGAPVVTAGLDDINTAVGQVNAGLDPFAMYLKEAAHGADQLSTSLLKVFNHLLGLSNAQIGYQQSLDDLTESIKINGDTLDLNTQKGRDNQTALNAAITDAIRVRDELAKTEGIDAANKKFNQMIKEIEGVAAQAGISKARLDEMVSKIYTVTIVTSYVTKGSRPTFNPGSASFASGEARAGGGDLMPGRPYIFGENGPELGFFGAQGRMLSNADSKAWVGGAGGGNVMWAAPVSTTPTGNALWDTFMEQFREQVAGRGGTLAVVGVRPR